MILHRSCRDRILASRCTRKSAHGGREREIAAVLGLLRNPDVRLVTLTGAGGTGKTRLSLQVAADLLDEFEHGVWFVELASITDPELVLPTLASTLKVKESVGTTIEQSLQDYLHKKQLLLVVDNFEQVVGAAPKIVTLLNAAPKIKIMISSREVLRLRGEHDYPVPPLGLPETKRKQTAAVLAQYEAISLFVQHAQAANPSFILDEENASTVAAFGHTLLANLIPLLGGGVGAFYTADEKGRQLRRMAGYAGAGAVLVTSLPMATITGLDYDRAISALDAAGGSVKTAIVMVLAGVDRETAVGRLAGGTQRRAAVM